MQWGMVGRELACGGNSMNSLYKKYSLTYHTMSWLVDCE